MTPYGRASGKGLSGAEAGRLRAHGDDGLLTGLVAAVASNRTWILSSLLALGRTEAVRDVDGTSTSVMGAVHGNSWNRDFPTTTHRRRGPNPGARRSHPEPVDAARRTSAAPLVDGLPYPPFGRLGDLAGVTLGTGDGSTDP